jgi:peroxiredoxin
MKLKDTLVALFTVALLGALGYIWFGGGGLKQAPAVTLQMLNGERVALDSLRGHPLMVTFWATSCVGCRREVPHLVDLYEKYRDRGFELVAVAMAYDPPEQVLRFRNDKQLPYRVALDLDGAAARAFDDVSLTPTTFVIAADGRIAFQTIGEFDTTAMESLIDNLLQQG